MGQNQTNVDRYTQHHGVRFINGMSENNWNKTGECYISDTLYTGPWQWQKKGPVDFRIWKSTSSAHGGLVNQTHTHTHTIKLQNNYPSILFRHRTNGILCQGDGEHAIVFFSKASEGNLNRHLAHCHNFLHIVTANLIYVLDQASDVRVCCHDDEFSKT